jgi:ABC-type transporter Mla MlaB component
VSVPAHLPLDPQTPGCTASPITGMSTGSAAPSMSISASLSALSESSTPCVAGRITTEPVALVVARGGLNELALGELQRQLHAALDEGAHVIVDLARVSDCDLGLFAVLERIHTVARSTGGWVALTGMSEPVLAALDLASVEQALMVYQASSWSVTDRAEGAHRRRAEPPRTTDHLAAVAGRDEYFASARID